MPYGLAGVLTNMQKPMLADYYSGSQSLKQLEDDLQQSIQHEKKGYICDEAYIIIISFIVGVIYSAYNIESVGLGLFFLPVGFAMASVILLVIIRPLKLFYSEHTNFSTHKIEQIQTNIKQIKQYESDLIKWENYNTETGIGYWLSLRGELLEQAVALLLQRQNWKVETTKRSGDGWSVSEAVGDVKKQIRQPKRGNKVICDGKSYDSVWALADAFSVNRTRAVRRLRSSNT
jgi:hypothetical protein